MFTLYCYLVALIPIIIFFILWLLDKRFNLTELSILVVFNLLFAFAFNFYAVHSVLADKETWSGKVLSTTYKPEWIEFYQQAIYKTISVGSGKNRHTLTVFSHWENRHRTHSKRYYTIDTFDRNIDIEQSHYERITKQFGGSNPISGTRTTWEHSSRMESGDKNDYIAKCGEEICPVTEIKSWENRVKACPSLFSYPLVNEGFDYPINSNTFQSDRLVGNSNKLIDIYEWDKINSILGTLKGANLIAVGFKDKDIKEAFNQESKWIGGKKNDLVICFSVTENKITWVKAFGWTESDMVKRSLESLILSKGFDLEQIVEIVSKYYTKKDWKKFNYLEVEISLSNYIWFAILMTIISSSWIAFSYKNEF